ncbi:MAG: YjbQ family protein [Chloroflexi bacterium]|nr:MAG: YjbQ family protein [Chloroflexota bacterium]
MGWGSFKVRTERRVQLLDVTRKVAQLVEQALVVDGVCYVFVPHTTAGVTINEGADPDVARDIEAQLGRMVPKDADYRHSEGNSDSHIKTVLVGPTVTAPVRQGKLSLGTWQAVFFCEWDGPRTRTIEVRVID